MGQALLGWPLILISGIRARIPCSRRSLRALIRGRLAGNSWAAASAAAPMPTMPKSSRCRPGACSPGGRRPARPDGGALADIQGADSRGTVELVGRQAQEVDPQLLDIHRNDAGGGHRVGVKGDFVFWAIWAISAMGSMVPILVVGQHDADENGLRRDGLFHCGGSTSRTGPRPGSHPLIQEAQGPQ